MVTAEYRECPDPGHAVSCDKQKYKIGILILTIENNFNNVPI